MIYFSMSHKIENGEFSVSSIYLCNASGEGIIMNKNNDYIPLSVSMTVDMLKNFCFFQQSTSVPVVYTEPRVYRMDDDVKSLAVHFKKHIEEGDDSQEFYKKLFNVINVFGEAL